MPGAARAAVVVGVGLALLAGGCTAQNEPAAPAEADVAPTRAPVARAAPPSVLPADPAEVALRLVEGTLAPDLVPAERVAEVAARILVPDCAREDEGDDRAREAAAEADLLRRLDVLRRLGPAAGGAVDAVIACGGRSEVTSIAAWATLDAIDPGRTLRIEPFLREAQDDHDDGLDARRGLWSARPSVLPRLVEVVRRTEGESWRAALTAAEVLTEFGPDAASALPALRAAMHDADGGSRLREAATEAVLRVSEGREPPLAEAVEWIVAREDLRALVVAARPGIDGELAALLGHERAEVRAAAGRVLFARSPGTPGVAAALAAGITVRDREVADACGRALVGLGSVGAEVVPALAELLQAPDRDVADGAAAALAASGDRETALPALRAAFSAPDCRAGRCDLASALVTFGPEQADLLVPYLVAMLGEEHTLGRRGGYRTVRGWWWAAECLGSLGPAAAPAIPALIDALDEDSGATEAARDALAKIGAAAVGPLAAAVAAPGRDEVRIGAAAALGRMGPEASRAVAALRGAFTDPSPRVRAAAAAAVVRIEPEATDAPVVLAAALSERQKETEPAPDEMPPEELVRTSQRSYEDYRRLREALEALGPGHAAALPAIRAAETDPEESIRIAAFDAERRITGDARPLVAECARQIDEKGYAYSAFLALPAAGAAAREALPALDRALLRQPMLVFDAEDAIAAADPSGRLLVASLAQVVASGSDSYVEKACEMLEALGPAAAAAVPALDAKLERICTWPQQCLVEALGAIGPAAKPAVPQIRLRLDDFYTETRAAAREALRRIEAQ